MHLNELLPALKEYRFIFEIIDILAVAYVFYLLYALIEKTHAIQVFKGIMIIVIMYFVAEFFQLRTILMLFGEVFKIAILVAVILFQPEIRRLLIKLGQNQIFGSSDTSVETLVEVLTETTSFLSHRKIGALIVIERKTGLRTYIDTGTSISGFVSQELIVTLFSKNTPLHDGAIIIQEDKLVAASCVLPLTKRTDLHSEFGMRHRAAIGLSEETDAVVIVVSEEAGTISITCENRMYYALHISKFKLLLTQFLVEDMKKKKNVILRIYEYFKERKLRNSNDNAQDEVQL